MSDKPSPYVNGTFGRVMAIAQIIAVLSIPYLGYVGIRVVALGEDVAEMRGNRHTSEDARIAQGETRRSMAEMQKQIAHIWKELAALPPDSFEAKVDGIVDRLHALELEVAALKKE